MAPGDAFLPDTTRREWLALGAGAMLCLRAANARSEDSKVSVLARLLEENRTRSPEYGGGLSNHLSMALIALSRLGASDARLAEYAALHAPRLEPLARDDGSELPADWTAALGRNESFGAFRRSFARSIADRGRAALLADALPKLAPGVASEAFHGLIRTAYAVDASDDAELAFGLAYFAAHHQVLPTPEGNGGPSNESDDPMALLARARATKTLASRRFRGNLITDVMDQAARQDGVAAVTETLVLGKDTLDRIAGAALRVYLATNDFTALHLVTGTHALRVLLPFVSDSAVLLRPFWRAVAIAYVGIGTPELGDVPSAASAPEWATVVEKAIASDDDHVVKLAYSSREEEKARGEPLYRAAAALRAGL